MNSLREQSLARAAARGDASSFGLLYDAYIGDIYRFVYYKTHHRPTAEDVTADIFTKAFASIGSYAETAGTFRTWLYAIARRTIIDHYRTSHPTAQIEDAWDIPEDSSQERDTDMQLFLEKVQTQLAALPSDQRDIILLRVWEGLSYQEIAERLGKSEGSCKMAFHRGITALQKTMPFALFLIFLRFV